MHNWILMGFNINNWALDGAKTNQFRGILPSGIVGLDWTKLYPSPSTGWANQVFFVIKSGFSPPCSGPHVHHVPYYWWYILYLYPIISPFVLVTLWWTNIAMENHHAINGKIHYKWPFSIAMLVHQRVNLNLQLFIGRILPISPHMRSHRNSPKNRWFFTKKTWEFASHQPRGFSHCSVGQLLRFDD